MTNIGLKRTVRLPFAATLQAIPEALKTEGFGVLTEIDIQDTLKKKIDVDFRRYKIIGACNPKLAHRALTASLDAGVMLPCNIIVYEDTPEQTIVVAVDPLQTAAAGHEGELKALVEEVRAKLVKVLERLA